MARLIHVYQGEQLLATVDISAVRRLEVSVPALRRKDGKKVKHAASVPLILEAGSNGAHVKWIRRDHTLSFGEVRTAQSVQDLGCLGFTPGDQWDIEMVVYRLREDGSLDPHAYVADVRFVVEHT